MHEHQSLKFGTCLTPLLIKKINTNDIHEHLSLPLAHAIPMH